MERNGEKGRVCYGCSQGGNQSVGVDFSTKSTMIGQFGWFESIGSIFRKFMSTSSCSSLLVKKEEKMNSKFSKRDEYIENLKDYNLKHYGHYSCDPFVMVKAPKNTMNEKHVVNKSVETMLPV